jgi:hypothetical protein
VAIGEVSIKLIEEPHTLVAKAAFVNSKSGVTHGYTHCSSWSKEVMMKMRELCALMAQDLENTHFEGGSAAASTVGVTLPQEIPAITGLGEFIGDGDIPQG